MSAAIPPLPDDPLAEELDRFVDRWRLVDRARELDRAPAFPKTEFAEMGAAGWLGLDRKTEDGARALPPARAGTLLYRLAYRAGTVFAKLSLQPGFSSVLEEHGSPALVERFYRPLVKGRRLVGNHLTEPDAGSDLGRLATVATRDGSEYRISGVKSEAAFATDADAAIVYARTPGSQGLDGITAFLIPQDSSGIRSTVIEDLGERWMRRGTVRYENVRVPIDHRIGDEGEGIRYVLPELARERAYLALIYLGVARASWEQTVRHVGERVVFDRPLHEHEAVAFPLVQDWGELESCRQFAERALVRIGAGERADLDTSLAKTMATTIALRTIDHAIQFHGGAGYSRALPHEQRYRDVRSGAIAHGATELLLRSAARAIWRPPRGRAGRFQASK